MTRISLRATGTAPAPLAWERYARFDEWSGWSPQIVRVEVDAERIAAGVTGKVFGPLGVSLAFRITAVDEAARTWEWTVRRLGVSLHLKHGVQSRKNGSATTLTVDGPLPVVVGYAPLARYAMGRLVSQ